MLGKNNKVCKMQQAGERFKKYTIKRLSIGVASVAVATGILFGGHAQTVAADDTTTTDQDALKEKAKDQHQQKEVVLGEGAPKTTVTPKATEKPVVKETPKEAAPAQNKQVEKAAVKKADAPKPTTLAAGPQTLKSAPLSTITQPKDYPNVPAIPDTEYIYATFESKNQWYKVYLTVNKANMPDKAVDQTVKVYVVRYDGYVMKNSNATLTPGATYHKVIDGIDLYINNSGQDVSLNSTNEAFYCRYYVSSHGNNSSYSWSVFNPQKVQQKVVYVQDKAKQGEDPSYQPIPGVEQGGVVDGVTGQHYDVNKNAAKVIKGFYLVTEPKLNGTLSQFKEDAEVVQTFYNGSTKTFQVFMKQTDDKGTMSCYYYKNGYKYTFTLAPGTSKYINLGSYQYYIANPYVTQTTKVQFVYAKVGQIVPVDKDGNPIAGINNGDYNKDYDNDQNDPKKVSPTKAPEIPGWKIVNPTQSTITPDKPGQDTKVVYEPIIDKVPVEGDVKQVITIEGLPADQQPNLNGLDKQTVKYKGTKTINHAPEAQGKKAIETIKWDANKTFKDVKVPVVKGFFADKKQVTGDATTPAQIGQTINKKITYKKMGHIIPTFNGKSIFPGVDNVDQPIYNNDANDPTKAAATDSPVIPGYHIKNPAQKTITPAEPGKNTVVEYEADEQKAKIVYIDNTTGKVIDATKFGITNPAEVTGKTAEVINYFPIKTIAKLQSQGFVRTAEDIAKSTWKQGVKFDNDTNKLQEFKVYLSHGETTIRPDDPRNKDDKYDLTRTVKRTIDYKYGAKTVKANKTASPTVTQTVTFERTKTIDTVTKKVIKTSDWTINKDSLKDLAAVVSPTIAGYTPDQAKVGQVTPNADSKDIEVHVIYNADNQKATVTYIDDTTGKEISVKNLTGKTGTTSDYRTADKIKELESKGYELVSNDYPKDGVVFDDDTKTDQKFTVHLKHKTETITPDDPRNKDNKYDLRRTVKRTIDYKYAGDTVKANQTAEPTVTQSVTFERTKTIDLVTNEIIKDKTTVWEVKPDTPKDLAEVVSPTIAGYTPDQAKIAQVTPNADSEDIVEHVIYNADNQKATVTYIDDTTGKEISVKNLTGKTGTTSDYRTADKIKELESKGYELVSNDYPKDGVVFDDDTKTDQKFTVHLKHKTETITPDDPRNKDNKYDLRRTVKRTIDYKYAGDTVKANQTAEPTVTQSVTFERTKTIDLVTNEIIKDKTTAWEVKPDTPKDLAEVVSPTIAGYTPDQAKIAQVTPNADSEDIVEHVIYNADNQKATVTYIDDTTGKSISVEKLTGKTGTTSDYRTAATIKDLEKKGYELVSNDYPKDGVVFDNDTAKDQAFEVHLKHTYKTVTPQDPETPDTPINPDDPTGPKYPKEVGDIEKTVTRTIKYKYGKDTVKADQQAADPVTQPVKFERTVTVDKVTGQVTKTTPWVIAKGSMDKVTSPAIAGYTPDQAEVAKETPKETDKDQTIEVIYHADEQKATVTYIDDTTGKEISVKNLTGKTGTTSDYRTADKIKELESKGYELVSNDYPKDGVVFDDDTKTDQKFTVHLKHKTETITPDDPRNKDNKYDLRRTVKRTIDYKYAGDTVKANQTASPTVTQSVTFERTKTIDLVTNEIIKDKTTAWEVKPDTPKDLAEVVSPTIAGYTPNQDKVAKVTPNADSKDMTVHIIYQAGEQKAKVIYWDDTDNTEISAENLTGKTGETSKYRTQPTIDELKKKGYEFVSEDYPTNGVVFDNDTTKDQVFKVHLKHTYKTVTPQDPETPDTPINPDDPNSPKYPTEVGDIEKTVTRTIKYKYGKDTVKADQQAADPVTQPVKFDRTVTVDKVTGKVTETTPWKIAKGSMDKVTSPAIAGYTPDQAEVAKETPKETDKDQTIEVIYHADEQKATVTYIDDTTGKSISVKELTGKTGTTSDYRTAATIKDLEKKGYELVSNDYPKDGVVFDNDTAKDQAFEVHLKHTYKTVTPQDPETPDTPINPDDPTGPKYPKEVGDIEKTVTRTIKYKYGKDTVKADQQAADPVTQPVKFDRTVTVDKVTGKVTETTPWKIAKGSMDKVTSPAIAGYTPDQAEVAKETPKETDKDQTIEVIYHADDQKATVTYVDDTTGETISVENLTGKTGTTSDYRTKATIEALEKKGYKLISDDYPANGVVFDSDTNKDQQFTVHLEHLTKVVTPDDPGNPDEPINPEDPNGPKYPKETTKDHLVQEIKRTIRYQYEDGSQAQPDVVQTATYHRTMTIDRVTGKVIATSAWVLKQGDNNIFKAVITPEIAGYTPDRKQVELLEISATTKSQVIVVTYKKNAAPKKVLPKTGDAAHMQAKALGGILVGMSSLMGLMGFLEKRRKTE